MTEDTRILARVLELAWDIGSREPDERDVLAGMFNDAVDAASHQGGLDKRAAADGLLADVVGLYPDRGKPQMFMRSPLFDVAVSAGRLACGPGGL